MSKSHSHSHRMHSISDIWRFVHAGRAVFTLVSTETHRRYTFQIAQAFGKPVAQMSDDGSGIIGYSRPRIEGQFWVRTLGAGSRWYPLGSLTNDTFKRYTSRIATANVLDKHSAAFSWFWRWLSSQVVPKLKSAATELPPSVEFWHEGQCGRCGRELTVPESIASGIGPECAKREEAQKLLAQLL